MIRCTVKFKCPKTWAQFSETESPEIRFCSHCENDVYLVRSKADLAEHAQKGHCVAILDVSDDTETDTDFDEESYSEDIATIGLMASDDFDIEK